MAVETPKEDAASAAPAEKTLLSRTQWMLFGGMLVLLILMTVIITVLLFRPAPAPAPAMESVAELPGEMETLERRLGVQERRLAELSDTLAEVQPRPGGDLSPALLDQLKEQERSTQQLIGVIKEGIEDLSRMIPGSRDWLELYSEQLDEVHAQSRLRLEQLQRLESPDSE